MSCEDLNEGGRRRIRRLRPAGRLLAGLGVLGLLTGPSLAGASPASDREAVTQALQASAVGWSKGDLNAFMAVYEQGDAPTYLNGAGVVHGYGAIRDMYAARFGGAAGMGALSTTILDYRPLGPTYALVIGRYMLARPASAGGDASGLFTLVFHKSAAGWRIISDHTA